MPLHTVLSCLHPETKHIRKPLTQYTIPFHQFLKVKVGQFSYAKYHYFVLGAVLHPGVPVLVKKRQEVILQGCMLLTWVPQKYGIAP